MKKIYIVVAMVVLALVVFVAEPLKAEPLTKAEAPVLIPGESWVFNDGWENRTETFSGEKDGLLVFVFDSGRKRYRTKELNVVRELLADGTMHSEHIPHDGILSFPLFVGKAWKQSYRNDNKIREIKNEVIGVETITVKAGAFESFVIKGAGTIGAEPTVITIWYSPAAKNIVKMTAEQSGGKKAGRKVEGKNYELVGYKQPLAANK